MNRVKAVPTFSVNAPTAFFCCFSSEKRLIPGAGFLWHGFCHFRLTSIKRSPNEAWDSFAAQTFARRHWNGRPGVGAGYTHYVMPGKRLLPPVGRFGLSNSGFLSLARFPAH
jgi:hypothetical protein